MRYGVAALSSAVFAGALLAGALLPGEAPAQSDREIIAAGKLKVAGRTMSCGRTPTLISRGFWDYGGAGGAGRKLIILNPDKLATLPEAVRLYVYAHECGHQIYGPNEPRADCYAVRRGKREGWLTGEGMKQICSFLKDHPGDYVHPPGPVRCEKMMKCFDPKTPQRARRGNRG
jgi:hypothetical protein